MLPTHYAQAAMSGTCYVLRLFVRYRSLWMVIVAMHIRSEMVLMSTKRHAAIRTARVRNVGTISLKPFRT